MTPLPLSTVPLSWHKQSRPSAYQASCKTTTGGYDGHGQQDINTPDDFPAARELLTHGPCILEKRQQFDREVSVMMTRDGRDQVRVFPIVENRHQHHVLHLTLAPAPNISPVLAKRLMISRLKLRLAWIFVVLGVELFIEGDNVVANEVGSASAQFRTLLD